MSRASRKPAWQHPPPVAVKRLLWDGVVISVLNPKIAVFFLAFLPQFVDPALGSIAQQMAMLGLLYVALALCTDGSYALLAGGLRHWLGRRIQQSPLPRLVTDFLYLGLGMYAALAGQRA